MKKIALLTGIIVAGFSFGAMAVTFAETIPGVDEPYDPTAYYSATAISWADSAPSSFALRDLANNGGLVYDYTRHIKSILFREKFDNIVEVETNKTSTEEKNTKNWWDSSISSTIAETLSMMKDIASGHRNKNGDVVASGDWTSSSVTQNSIKIMDDLKNNHLDNVTSYDLSEKMGTLFWGHVNTEFEAMGRNPTSWEKQEAWLKKVHSEVGESSKNIAADQMQINAANEYALQLSNEAEGKVQGLVANTMAQSIKTQAVVDVNEMYAKLLQLKTINMIQKIDEEQHENDINSSIFYHVVNPYDENAYKYAKDNYGIERLQGHGMPDFK